MHLHYTLTLSVPENSFKKFKIYLFIGE